MFFRSIKKIYLLLKLKTNINIPAILINKYFIFQDENTYYRPIKIRFLMDFLFLQKNFAFPYFFHILHRLSHSREQYASIAQLDRVAVFEAVGCRFDSYWVHHNNFAHYTRNLSSELGSHITCRSRIGG